MNKESLLIFQGFLAECDPQKKEGILNCLSNQFKELIEQIPPLKDPLMEVCYEDTLDHIHYSWLAPFIRMHTEEEMRLFLSALTESQAKGLRKTLLLTNNPYSLTPIAKTFLKNYLLTSFFKGKEVVSAKRLPEDPLNELLSLTAEELYLLSSFLGLRDLSVEMRLIIDNAKIKQIENVLTKHEALYLKTLMQQKEPIVFKPIGVAKWDGNITALKAAILQRGLNRLSKALYGHGESLFWYITHKLDNNMGKALTSFYTPVESEKASTLLLNQVLELIPNIKNLTLSSSP